ncbi:hypothetical protein GCM10017788_71530 [Amycolatopsis acidiphila]|nr:hypothetical protein GCM10017788_71530 [Amycolatopsis acidiphila]
MAVARARAQVTGRVLPVRRELRDLLPEGGLRRGSTVAVRGSTSLLLALLAEATATGSWAAAVGMPDLGLVAAGELGVEVGRLALVPRPGVELASVTAALLDGMDLVAVVPGGTASSVARRLSARARHRGAVLLSLGPWPGADLELGYETGEWTGLASGAGHLRARQADIRVAGRGSAARPRYAELMLPGPAEATDHRAPAPRFAWMIEPASVQEPASAAGAGGMGEAAVAAGPGWAEAASGRGAASGWEVRAASHPAELPTAEAAWPEGAIPTARDGWDATEARCGDGWDPAPRPAWDSATAAPHPAWENDGLWAEEGVG